MRPDIRWRITPQETEKLNKKNSLSFITMIVSATIFLIFVYLVALYDQEANRGSTHKIHSISIPLSQFQPVKPIIQSTRQEIEELPLQKVLKNLNLKDHSFILAQLGSSNSYEALYYSSASFYKFISKVFENDLEERLNVHDFDPLFGISDENNINSENSLSYFSFNEIALVSLDIYERK